MDHLRNSKKYLHYWVFQGLFIIGFMFHQTEEWDSRPLAFFSLASLIIFVLVPKLSDWVFLTLLAVCCYINLDKFPNLANHSNLTLFLGLLIFVFHIKLILKPEKLPFDGLFKTLRLTIFILYFFAVFHKLNWDFLNPEVSCANRKLADYFSLIPASFDFIKPWIRSLMPALGILIEGAVPLLLFFSKPRGFGLFILVLLHFTLAPMGFTDFSSFAMALAWCFVDPQKIHELRLKKDFCLLSLAVFVLASVLGLTRYGPQLEAYEFTEGLFFALLYTPFLWIHLKDRYWMGSFSWPKAFLQKAFIVLFFIFGFSNYLGLRTAGTFSMFSNLKTEGSQSNHILLGSNPFKFFSFQEDNIEVLDVSQSIAGFYRRMPDLNQKIPIVEFSRILDILRHQGWDDVSMTIRYQGEVFSTTQAGFDENFDIDAPYWQKKLFKFRHIQLQGPQQCLW